jgi:hypothetical protein
MSKFNNLIFPVHLLAGLITFDATLRIVHSINLSPEIKTGLVKN